MFPALPKPKKKKTFYRFLSPGARTQAGAAQGDLPGASRAAPPRGAVLGRVSEWTPACGSWDSLNTRASPSTRTRRAATEDCSAAVHPTRQRGGTPVALLGPQQDLAGDGAEHPGAALAHQRVHGAVDDELGWDRGDGGESEG